MTPNVVATGVTDRLEEKDMVTLTFTMGQVNAAAYLIEPGDFVNMLAMWDLQTISGGGEEEAAAEEGPPLHLTNRRLSIAEVSNRLWKS